MTTRTSKRRPAPKPTPVLSAKGRKEALVAVSGVERQKPALPLTLPDKGRAGRKGVVIYLHPAAKEALVQIAHEHRKSLQDLGIEAFNQLFLAYSKKPIA